MVERVQKIVGNKLFNNFLFAIILLSAIIIGLETYPELVREYKVILSLADKVIVAIFTFEIILKIIAHGKKPGIISLIHGMFLIL
ncbi:MAG: ion transporter [Saprospiraceae bacterium]|nr:ion transporter [Saprospiraceae bacterium]